MKRATRTGMGATLVVAVGIAALAIGPLAAGAATMSAALMGGSKADDTAEAFTWTDDADCSKCHVKQAESMENEKLLASKHAVLDCAFCHEYQDPALAADETAEKAAPAAAEGAKAATDEAAPADEKAAPQASPTMAEVHKNVTKVSTVKKSALVNTVVSESACLTCHDRDALIEATADCDLLTDAHGTTVNPHDIVEGAQHDAVLCEDCHKMHSSDPAAAYRACVGCHHAEVWECGTCHSYVKNETL